MNLTLIGGGKLLIKVAGEFANNSEISSINILTSERHFLFSASAGQSKTQRNSKIREIIERRSKEVALDDT